MMYHYNKNNNNKTKIVENGNLTEISIKAIHNKNYQNKYIIYSLLILFTISLFYTYVLYNEKNAPINDNTIDKNSHKKHDKFNNSIDTFMKKDSSLTPNTSNENTQKSSSDYIKIYSLFDMIVNIILSYWEMGKNYWYNSSLIIQCMIIIVTLAFLLITFPITLPIFLVLILVPFMPTKLVFILFCVALILLIIILFLFLAVIANKFFSKSNSPLVHEED